MSYSPFVSRHPVSVKLTFAHDDFDLRPPSFHFQPPPPLIPSPSVIHVSYPSLLAISSLFSVGASTHPGTGVPIVLAGSKLTTAAILESFSLPLPPALPSALSSLSVPYGGKPRTALATTSRSELDRVRKRNVMDLERWVQVLAMLMVVFVAWSLAQAVTPGEGGSRAGWKRVFETNGSSRGVEGSKLVGGDW